MSGNVPGNVQEISAKLPEIFQEMAKDEMGNVITQVPPSEAPPVPPSVDQCKENSAQLASLLAVDDAQSQPAQEEPPRKQARKLCPDRRSSQMGLCLAMDGNVQLKRKLASRNPNSITESTLSLSWGV